MALPSRIEKNGKLAAESIDVILLVLHALQLFVATMDPRANVFCVIRLSVINARSAIFLGIAIVY